MAATLQEILLAPGTRPKVARDCYALVQQEMADKSGISATAVKLAYKTASTFAPGHIQHMIDTLIPGMAATSSSRSGLTSPLPEARSSVTTWPSAAMRCRRPCSR